MTDASAFVLDGAAIADETLVNVAEDARALIALGLTPGLAVVLVGDDPASQSYVAGKGRAAKACGFHSIEHNLPAETSEAELLTLVHALNADPAVHGILVQLPLPEAIDSTGPAGHHGGVVRGMRRSAHAREPRRRRSRALVNLAARGRG